MFNSATLAVILLFILSAILFTSTTVSIAIYYARKKADTEEKALITKNDYKKTILIFSIINFIASFAACSKADKTERAAVFAAICAPYYIFIVSSPIVPYIIAVTLYPC